MRRKHQPKPGWNDETDPMAPAPTPAQIDRQIDEATKEVTDTVGMGGSLGRVRSGGVGIKTGAGMEAIVGGVRKTTIEPDGDFFAGSDIDDPAGLSLAVFVNAQNWNGEDMEEGDALFGDNSEGSSNIKWDASEGQWQFRLGTTVQVYMDTDGTIRAGGTRMDAGGVTFDNGTANQYLVFKDSSGNPTMFIASTVDDALTINNITPGKPIRLIADTTDSNAKTLTWVEDPANANVTQLNLAKGAAGGKISLDTSVIIWAAKDGEVTVFNDDEFDIDFRVSDWFLLDEGERRLEIGADHYFPTQDASNPNVYLNETAADMDIIIKGDTDEELFWSDAGLDAIGIGGAAESGYKLKVHGDLKVTGSVTGGVTAETNANNIFQCSNPGGTSAFTGTINGAPSGTSVVYTPGSGTEGAMVPASTSQLAKMRLYNTTRSNSALISDCDTGTNTITLTATVPADWANGDALTIASQTVSGGGFSWVDMEITSGPTDKPAIFISHVMNSASVGDALRVHPLEAFSSSKASVNIALTASQNCNGFGLLKLTSNVFSLSWTGTPAVVVVREAGYLG
jgi:hypothetical protein